MQQPVQQSPQQQQQQQQYRPPMQQQAPQQPMRTPLPSARRVGVSPRLQQQQQPAQQQLGGSLQRLASSAAAAVPAQGRADATTEAVQAAAGQQPPAEVNLARSQLMDKEVITRTSANRLGYVTQLFVDPGSLSVTSVYLRRAASSLSSLGENAADQDHMLLDSLQQISDVVLVHDENALEAFPLDDSMGYCRLVGAEVVTETGISLGKVRDFLFSPDTGAISTIKYDKLGVPSLPQALLSCYSISWEDVKALGPTRLVVYSGTELRAIKENDGIVDEGVALLVNIIAGPEKGQSKTRDGGALAGAAQPAAALGVGDDSRYRTDQAYYDWYVQHGAEYERQYGVKLDPPAGWADPEYAAQQRAAQQPLPPRAPPALPPPQAPTFAQTVQSSQPASQPAPQQGYQQGYQQQMFQQQRQAVPAGAGSWGAPPAAPPQQQRYAPPPQQQGAYPPRPQQQARQQQAPPPQQQPRAPPAQQPLPPQNGIPIIDRTPLPPYRRRDADGNYGSPPQRQQPRAPPAASQQQQPRAPQAASQQWQQPRSAAVGQQVPSAGQQAPRQAPVVVPDAVIPGGSVGSSGGTTQVAEYLQL